MGNNKIYLETLGCAKNLVDSEVLTGGLKSNDYSLVNELKNSEIVIVNTCGFLDRAREEGINRLIELCQFKKEKKIKQLIAVGCLTDRYGDDISSEMKEIDAVFGSESYADVLSYLTGKDYKKDDPDFFRSLLTPSHYAYLKISEGCDNGCSFCSIPLMRGMQVSQPIEWNVLEAKRVVESGVKELLVIGQDTTSYGWDLSEKIGLHDLLFDLDKVEGVDWIRLHYAHPAHLNHKVISSFGSLEKLLPYIDMPIQHGSDRMLKLMRRGLGRDGIMRRINLLREEIEDIAIRTSIIVGFPGESDQDFEDLLSFIEEAQFDRLGVFRYSEEEGTYGADHLNDDIPAEVKEDRYNEVMLLQQKINHQKNIDLIGSIQKVLIDVVNDNDCSIGRTYRDSPEIDNYVTINSALETGSFYNVKITKANEYDLVGEVID